MKNWKVPGIILVLLIVAIMLRWGTISSTTNNGIVTKTLVDRWNGTIWQEIIKSGSYSEKIVSPSWFESMRKPIEKQVEYQEADYSKSILKSDIPSDSKFFAERQKLGIYDFLYDNIVYVTKTRTIQAPPPAIYWLSRNGLTKIWGWLVVINIIWLLIAVNKTKRVEAAKEATIDSR